MRSDGRWAELVDPGGHTRCLAFYPLHHSFLTISSHRFWWWFEMCPLKIHIHPEPQNVALFRIRILADVNSGKNGVEIMLA